MHPDKIILIVDDDNDDVDFYCEAFFAVDNSIKCLRASNGEEAIQWLQSNKKIKPDYIFLDLNMPKMNGRKFLNLIKSDPDFNSIPVVINTTSDSKEDDKEVKEMGAVCFLTKPTNFSILKNAISLILDRNWDMGPEY